MLYGEEGGTENVGGCLRWELIYNAKKKQNKTENQKEVMSACYIKA